MAPSGAVKGADGTNGSGSVGPFSQCGGGLSLPGASDREAPGAIPITWSVCKYLCSVSIGKKI